MESSLRICPDAARPRDIDCDPAGEELDRWCAVGDDQLWVIALVVVFGRFLGNSEHRDTGRAFLWRVAGTLLLTVAIVIAVMDRARMAVH